MKFINTLLFIILTMSFAGCGIEQRSSSNVRYFLLDVQRPDTSVEAASGSCLHIRPCRVASQFAGRSLVYRTGTVLYEQDYYNLFLTNPDDQVADILRAWFRQSGLTDCVSMNEKQSKKYTLEPRIDILCADFTDKENAVAIVRMHVLVTTFDESCSCVKTILEKTYTAETPLLPKPTAAQVVEGLSQSLYQTIKQLENSLQEIL